MKLGLLTAAFPSLSLAEVADWAAANGFEALEIACWPAAGAERRRYAGVSHIGLSKAMGSRSPRSPITPILLIQTRPCVSRRRLTCAR
jgi:hypothetical protein